MNNENLPSDVIELPKRLVKRYKQILRNRKCLTGSVKYRNNMKDKNLQTPINLKQELGISQDTAQNEELLESDFVASMMITGESKFNSESQSVQALRGEKYFVRNHYKTQYGEDEPFESEEILAVHK